MLSKIKDYGLGHEVKNVLNTGIIMKIDQWKQKVKEKVIEKEHLEWIATGLMYESVKEFKSLEVSIKTGWDWWRTARWDCKLLQDIKFMLNVLCINLKCGHSCKCSDQPSITHILFGCVLITNTRGQMWSTVKNSMPPAMIASVDSMSQEEKVVFIYKFLNVPPNGCQFIEFCWGMWW